MASGTYTFTLKAFVYDIQQIFSNHHINEGGEIQKYVDSEVLRLCEPKVPKDVGTLIQSGIQNTQIGSGEVKYRTPYARRWYYRNANFQDAPERGTYWFERMKNQYKDKILEGAKKHA